MRELEEKGEALFANAKSNMTIEWDKVFAYYEESLADLEKDPDNRTLHEELTDGVSLSPMPDMLFQLFSYLTGGERKQKAKRLAWGEDPDGDAATMDVLAALQKFPNVRPDPEAFIECLDAAAEDSGVDVAVALLNDQVAADHGGGEGNINVPGSEQEAVQRDRIGPRSVTQTREDIPLNSGAFQVEIIQRIARVVDIAVHRRQTGELIADGHVV